MTTEQKIIRGELALQEIRTYLKFAGRGRWELAKQLGNVSQACKMMGYSRDSFYRFKELYDRGAGIIFRRTRSRC